MFDVIFLFIYASIGCSLVLMFGYIQTNIQNELLKSARRNVAAKDRNIKMFDSLQEGIVVLQGPKLIYMNDISNKMLSHVTEIKDFIK